MNIFLESRKEIEIQNPVSKTCPYIINGASDCSNCYLNHNGTCMFGTSVRKNVYYSTNINDDWKTHYWEY